MSLRLEQFGRVRRITLADAARRNVLTELLATDLLKELWSADADEDTGAILLDGEGPVFCGGADSLAELPGELLSFGCRITKPVVAAVQGVAVSAGVALLANAQVVVAAQGSSFGLTDIRDGRFHTQTFQAVARAIGKRRAQELALTGRIFTTPEALAWGLVHAVTPAFELDDRASAIATALATSNASVARLILEASR
jgi:enoyl-CoA hydratase/carnithine racemase